MKHVFATLLFASSLTLPAAAEPAFKIKPTVTVTGASLSLADLVEGDNLPTTPLFAAPAPGESGIISSERVSVALKRAGITAMDKMPPAIMITRAGRVIDRSVIKNLIVTALADARAVTPSNIIVSEEAFPKTLVVEQGTIAPLEISALTFDPATKNFTAELTMRDSVSLSQRRITLSGRFEAYGECLKLAQMGKKGDVLTTNDLVSERCALSNTTQAPAPRASLIGLALADDYAAGTLIDPSKLKKPILVEKGASVTLTYVVGGLTLILRGRSSEAGALGDTITVTHPQTKRSLDAIVTGQGTASVASAFPGKLASLDLPSTTQVKP